MLQVLQQKQVSISFCSNMFLLLVEAPVQHQKRERLNFCRASEYWQRDISVPGRISVRCPCVWLKDSSNVSK